MTLRDVFPEDSDIIETAQDIDVMREWLSAHRRAAAAVRISVERCIANLISDLTTGTVRRECAAFIDKDIIDQLHIRDTLLRWKKSPAGCGAPKAVICAVDDQLDLIDDKLANTVSDDLKVLQAQAQRAAEIIPRLLAKVYDLTKSQHMLRESMFARSLCAGLATVEVAP